MPRRERPSPLLDAAFHSKVKEPHDPTGLGTGNASPEPEEIPVHNTFIQFGVPPLEGVKQHLSTAPAWIGQPSLKNALLAATDAARVHHPEETWSLEFANSDGSLLEPGSSPKKLASPKKVPVMRYSLSSSSARAAGLPANATGAVFANYNADCVPGRVGTTATSSTVDDGVSLSGGGNSIRGGADTVVADCDLEEEGESSNDARNSPHSLTVANTPVHAIEPDLPSLGSAKHAEGLCKRCCFFPKGRCLNGRECEFCHFEHEKRKRKKKKKGTKQDQDQAENSDSDVSPDVRGDDGLVGPALDPMTATRFALSIPASPGTPRLPEAAFATSATAGAAGFPGRSNSNRILPFASSPTRAPLAEGAPQPPSTQQLQLQQQLHHQLQHLQLQQLQLQQQQQALTAQLAQVQSHGQSPTRVHAHSSFYPGAHADGFGLYGSIAYSQMYGGGPSGAGSSSGNNHPSAAAGFPGSPPADHAAAGAGLAGAGPLPR